jgi:hypothetical protein
MRELQIVLIRRKMPSVPSILPLQLMLTPIIRTHHKGRRNWRRLVS